MIMPETKNVHDTIETRVIAPAVGGFARAESDDKGGLPVIEGYAALFDTDSSEMWQGWSDAFIERIAPSAFHWDDVRALVNHDPNLMLARTAAGTLSLEQDKKGLRYSFRTPDTSVGRDLATNVGLGNISQSSFAFRVEEEEWEWNDDGPDLRTIKKAEVFDVSPVTYPAYPDTTVGQRAHKVWQACRDHCIEGRRYRLGANRMRVAVRGKLELDKARGLV